MPNKEKYIELKNINPKEKEEILNEAWRDNVKFTIVSVEGQTLKETKNYRLKFTSRKDLNAFKRIVKKVCPNNPSRLNIAR